MNLNVQDELGKIPGRIMTTALQIFLRFKITCCCCEYQNINTSRPSCGTVTCHIQLVLRSKFVVRCDSMSKMRFTAEVLGPMYNVFNVFLMFFFFFCSISLCYLE